MAGEVIKDFGSWVDLEASGASISNAAMGAADDAAFNTLTDARPHIEFELEITLGANASGAPFVQLYAQELDYFGGSNDSLAPATTNLNKLVRSELLATGTTSTQRFRFTAMFAPVNASYYLYNGSGQTISSGWKLRARGMTLKAA